MLTKQQLSGLLADLKNRVSVIIEDERVDVILFGSYARGDYDEGSDVDALILTEVPREKLIAKNWEIGDLASDMLFDYGVVVSPIVENRNYFNRNADTLPFFRNVMSEGIMINA